MPRSPAGRAPDSRSLKRSIHRRETALLRSTEVAPLGSVGFSVVVSGGVSLVTLVGPPEWSDVRGRRPGRLTIRPHGCTRAVSRGLATLSLPLRGEADPRRGCSGRDGTQRGATVDL